jgi:hypothetical protein
MYVGTVTSEIPVSHLHQDYAKQRGFFEAQPLVVRLFLEQQARQIDEALLAKSPRIRFDLPERIQPPGGGEPLSVPTGSRRQAIGDWLLLLRGLRKPSSAEVTRKALVRFLAELENDSDPALALVGAAMRYAVASVMVHQLLPDGRAVTYMAAAGDGIPSLPVDAGRGTRSALTARSDAIVEGEAEDALVQVPFTPAARRFFLPQWVAFDEDDRLLVNRAAEAEGHLASMQSYIEGLHHALAIAPYMAADETYQRKRAGMLGQLVNQGRALARFYTRDIIVTIEQRAREGNLNRGLDLSMPYFDDLQLRLRTYAMTVVPGGRIVFLPAFVVRAVRLEAGKVAQDARINSSTRKHLLVQFAMLEEAFLHFSLK